MSLQLTNRVWEHSKARLGAKLVLLCLADHADENGVAFPSVKRIADRTDMSERAVQSSITILEILGELKIRKNEGPRGVNIYVISVNSTPAESATPPADNSPPQQKLRGAENDIKGCSFRQEGVQFSTVTPAESAPKPSKNRQRTVSNHHSAEPSSEGLEFADWFRSLLPGKIKLGANYRTQWAEEFDKMKRLDGRTVDEIRLVCEWARSDKFWASNFMSPMKLRDKNGGGITYFDVFAAKAMAKPINGHPKVSHTEKSQWGI